MAFACGLLHIQGHAKGHEVNDEDINTLIDEADLPERSIRLCIKGKLVAQFEALEQQRADAASRIDVDSLAGGGGESRAFSAEMEALREKMKASTITVVMRALPRKKWRKLLDQHPPRRDEEGTIFPADRAGFNNETIIEPLIRACWATPVLTPERMTHLLDEVVSDRQYERLAELAWAVNRDDVDIPFSLAASKEILDSLLG